MTVSCTKSLRANLGQEECSFDSLFKMFVRSGELSGRETVILLFFAFMLDCAAGECSRRGRALELGSQQSAAIRGLTASTVRVCLLWHEMKYFSSHTSIYVVTRLSRVPPSGA